MEVNFRARSITLTSAQTASLRQRVWTSLGRFSPAISEVNVAVRDINGPRGGIDTECVVRVSGRAGWRLVVIDTSDSISSAVGSSLARVRRTVARKLGRLVQVERGPAPALGVSS